MIWLLIAIAANSALGYLILISGLVIGAQSPNWKDKLLFAVGGLAMINVVLVISAVDELHRDAELKRRRKR